MPGVTAAMSSAIDPAARAQPTTWTTSAALRRDVPPQGDNVRDDRARTEDAWDRNGTAPSGRVSFCDRLGHVGRLLCLGARGSRRGRRGRPRRRSWPRTGSNVLGGSRHGRDRCRRSRYRRASSLDRRPCFRTGRERLATVGAFAGGWPCGRAARTGSGCVPSTSLSERTWSTSSTAFSSKRADTKASWL